MPKDRFCENDVVVDDTAARHHSAIAIVVAALQGFVSAIRATDERREPLRLLLTGYAEWGTVTNNPTADLLRHDDSVAAIRAAMPAEVQVATAVLPVDDAAIDGGPLSIQHAITVVRPHAILSLGVHNSFSDNTSATYFAEHNASDRHLVEVEGGFHREPQLPARTRLPSNPALARALHRQHG